MAKLKITMIDYIRKVADYNARQLKIVTPKIKVVSKSSEVFATPTTQAAISSDGKNLYINKMAIDGWEKDEQPFNVWLVISHECRHAWQEHDKNFRKHFDNYKNSASLSVQDYNLQPAEIDAWAWAILLVGKNFGVRPTLEQQLGLEVWSAILKRIDEICPPPHPLQSTIDEIVALKDFEKMKEKMLSLGFFDASKDSRTKAANLQEIARGSGTETEWINAGRYEYHIHLCENVKGYERLIWLWIQRNEMKESDDPFEKPYFIPQMCWIYAKEV